MDIWTRPQSESYYQCCSEIHVNETACLYYIQTFFRPILVLLGLSSCLMFLFSNMHTHKHTFSQQTCFQYSIKCTVFPLFPSSAYSICLGLLKPSLCSHHSSLLLSFFFSLCFTLCLQPLGYLEFCTCNSCKKLQMINIHKLTCVILFQKVGSVRWTDFSSSSGLRSQMVDADILILRRVETSTQAGIGFRECSSKSGE